MNKTAKIQIPLDYGLKTQAEQMASVYGYSSLQEVVRVFLTGFVSKSIRPTFTFTPDEVLSPKEDAALKDRLDGLCVAMDKGEIYTTDSGKDLVKLAKKVK
jgi:hypothetical protein